MMTLDKATHYALDHGSRVYVLRFKRFLRRANIVLGSLASIFPVTELFKEYKEAAEATVEEVIEDAEEEAKSVS